MGIVGVVGVVVGVGLLCEVDIRPTIPPSINMPATRSTIIKIPGMPF